MQGNELQRDSRSLAGAWIETILMASAETPSDRRSLAGAWIETRPFYKGEGWGEVAPSRERGLKLSSSKGQSLCVVSLPRGSVD